MIGLTPLAARIPAGATTPEDELATRHAVGWSIDEAARTLLDQFDDDGDGSIYHQRFLGLRFGSEARTTTSQVTWTLGMLAGRPDDGLVRVTTHTTWNLERLVRRADVDGNDIASRTEIAALLHGFDTNRDGRLSTTEFQRARAELGAVQGHTWRTVDAVDRDRRRRR